MFKGYRNYIFYKDQTNKTINSLPQITKCVKCNYYNTYYIYPNTSNNNTINFSKSNCYHCGNPYYIK